MGTYIAQEEKMFAKDSPRAIVRCGRFFKSDELVFFVRTVPPLAMMICDGPVHFFCFFCEGRRPSPPPPLAPAINTGGALYFFGPPHSS